MGRKFTCERCHQTYDSGRSEEDKEQEMLSLWGNLAMNDRASVCTSCFEEFMEWMHQAPMQ